MKKFLIFMVTLIMLSAPKAFASEVIATGQGENEQTAIHAAMRAAIEKELGVIIDSKTLVQHRQTVRNEVYANSRGFIESYEILRSSVVNGLIEVEIKANVRSDELKTDFMSKLQKQSLIKNNLNDPRIVVVAFDDFGREYVEVENTIIATLQNEGFSRIVDVNQLDKSIKVRLANAAGDISTRQSLQNQFHADYLIKIQVQTTKSNNIHSATLNARMIGVNTGEILYTNSFTARSRMFTNNSVESALKSASQRAAKAVATAALNKAAQVEQHITIIITKNTLDNYGRNIVMLNARIKNLQGVNNIFTRSVNNGTAEVDVNFDGTAYELATALENIGINIIEINSEYIKI